MTLFTFRGVKSHGWTFYDPNNMLSCELDRDTSVLIVRPEGPLAREDFRTLAEVVDPYILETGPLKALIIHVKSFPGWENLTGLVEHFRFVRDHHRLIGKVALVSDSKLASFAPKIAAHFVSAEISVFPFEKLDEAREWISGAK
jgi:hypothetical protein